MPEIEDIISTFEPISLSEMDEVKLMNRIDTKYAVPIGVLSSILKASKQDYFAQEINGKRIASYDTLYYDTDSLEMYVRHHDRQLVRQKIRIRQYVNTNETYLEIKRKDNKGRTRKKRMTIPGFSVRPDTLGHTKREDWSVEDFIASKSNYHWEDLSPHLTTRFNRITLVNKAKTERLTIDMNLVWENVVTGEKKTFPELVIIELKRNGHAPSQMISILRGQRIKPLKISKYCIGTALTTPGLKKNRFKAKIRTIEKMLTNS